ncbi:hypothetical protein PU345_002135 [Enterobacter kobei]|nr:hypothetical protein [Enterobacter kobei]
MKIYGVVIGEDHLCLESEIGSDFWITLGDGAGWGRFSMLRPLREQCSGRSLFKLVEILPGDAIPPVAVIDTGNLYQFTKQIHDFFDKALSLPQEKPLAL